MKAVLQISYDPQYGEERATSLAAAGFRVVSAGNNAEAKQACSSDTFDAILLGFASPLPNRKEMFNWLREHCPGVPIISLYSRQFVPVPKADYAVDGENSAWLDVLKRILA